MPLAVSESELREWGAILKDKKQSLAKRFRALFSLRHAKELLAIDLIAACFYDEESDLLKHELAYCLGQKCQNESIKHLQAVLNDQRQAIIVRHEAAEALGAIGNEESRQILEQYKQCDVQELAETCQLALNRLDWLKNPDKFIATPETSEANGVTDGCVTNPAPTFRAGHYTIDQLREILLDDTCTQHSLFDRYRALFTLEQIVNDAGKEDESADKLAALRVICDSLNVCVSSALFRHEVAFVLGGLARPESIASLENRLRDRSELGMVRHECAEALGSIAGEQSRRILNEFLGDDERVVRESCEVALDVADYMEEGMPAGDAAGEKESNDAHAAAADKSGKAADSFQYVFMPQQREHQE